MQLYLPDDLHGLVKTRVLPASELFQKAVRAVVRRLDLLAETDRYVAKLIKKVGAPSALDRKHAASVARRLERRPIRKAG